jgi:thioredoxin reductase (NADPH)
VFTPLELGTVGLTEEEAVQMYGEEAVDSYAAEFEPLEWNLLHRHADAGVLCYIKVITNRLDGDRVIGMHIAAPNAGEIIQGFSLAFRKGITHKVDLNFN